MASYYTKFARKFTDEEYLSKKELVYKVGSNDFESIWKAINDYRETYRFTTNLKKIDGMPFTVCLTPALLSYSNVCEKRMIEFCILFEKLKAKESISEEKVVKQFKMNSMISDFIMCAKKLNLAVQRKDIELILNYQGDSKEGNILYGLKNVFDLFNENKKTFNTEEILKINYLLTGDDGFRKNDVMNYPSANSITENISNLCAFVKNYSAQFSTFLLASVCYGYFLYTMPFKSRSDITGLLLASKVLKDGGYGDAVLYTGLLQKVYSSNRFVTALDYTRMYGDLTYMFVAFCEQFIEAIDDQFDQLSSIKEPIPSEVRTVIKEVPVEVIKEVQVIKEVPVEVVKEKVIKVHEDDDFEEEFEEETPVEEFKKAEKIKNTGFNFSKDPFTGLEEMTAPEREELPVAKEEPKKELRISSEMDMLAEAKSLKELENNEMAKKLLEANPNMRQHQAYFYAHHHEFGKYYTISQFKDFATCAYETARTSMDYLVAVNLYEKTLLKNKYVYTPKSLED